MREYPLIPHSSWKEEMPNYVENEQSSTRI